MNKDIVLELSAPWPESMEPGQPLPEPKAWSREHVPLEYALWIWNLVRASPSGVERLKSGEMRLLSS